MRIDMEQFLAVTVALGAAGAAGLAVYSTTQDDEEPVPVVEEPQTTPADVGQAAPPEPKPKPKPKPEPEPAAEEIEVPDSPDEPVKKEPVVAPSDTPGPDVETPSW